MSVTTTARLMHCSIPPRKMRLVANLVKGLPIQKALDILNFTKRAASYHIAKTLKSAAANAFSMVGTDHVKPEDLYVKNITVDPAPSAKRIRFQSMGRVFRYRKRHSHLTVVLEERASTPVAAPAPSKVKAKASAAGTTGDAQVKKSSPTKAKSAVKKSAKKAPAKAAKKSPAKGKKAAPAKKAKKTK